MEILLTEAVLKTKHEEMCFHHNVDINRPLGVNIKLKRCSLFAWTGAATGTSDSLSLSIGLSEKAKVKFVQSLLTEHHIIVVGEFFK